MHKVGIAFSALFVVGSLIAALAPAEARAIQVPAELQLQPRSLSCVANCTPGGAGNTFCQNVFGCGPGSVCLSIDDNSHGRCNSGNGGQR